MKKIREYQKKYRIENKEKRKDYLEKNKEKLKKQAKEYKIKNDEKIAEYRKEYLEKNKGKIKKQLTKYYIENKEKIQEYRIENKEKMAEYRIKNKEKIVKKNKEYYQKNKEKIAKYIKERRLTRPTYKLLGNLRNRLNRVLKGNTKSSSTRKLIGCDIEFLKKHLESQFTKGMAWDNHGNGWHGKREWHIDHIKPCASFDLSKPEEQCKCFHYTNLQPLWAEDNLKKGSLYEN